MRRENSTGNKLSKIGTHLLLEDAICDSIRMSENNQHLLQLSYLVIKLFGRCLDSNVNQLMSSVGFLLYVKICERPGIKFPDVQ